IQDLPPGLRYKTTRLQSEGAIDIASMMLIKSIGADGTDIILQLVRRVANGAFTAEKKLLAVLFAELIFPCFRELESERKNECSSVAATLPVFAQNLSAPVQQIATEAIQAIQAIALAAMDGQGGCQVAKR